MGELLCAAQTVILLFAPPMITPPVAGHATSVRADGIDRSDRHPIFKQNRHTKDEHKGDKQFLFCNFHVCVKRPLRALKQNPTI